MRSNFAITVSSTNLWCIVSAGRGREGEMFFPHYLCRMFLCHLFTLMCWQLSTVITKDFQW